ncbi:putative ankyrin repeat protein RF_0381 [Haliotis rubra]|uniref:putative ankyrin repeat protein RF_0381 n=1 Tax=Haliotis rubra TaxID=36100 RepID=UPI001EE6046C|nr:putative ankyrin repeat protein RF_0381 [Haliotis rubra]
MDNNIDSTAKTDRGAPSQHETKQDASPEVIPVQRRSGAEHARRLLQKLGPRFFYKNGATLLHHCLSRPVVYVYVLVQGGVPVNVQNSDGDSALHISVRAGNYAMTQALLQCSADLGSRNKLGQTPLDIAEGAIRDLLLRYQGGVVQAVMQGKSQTLDRLCKHTWCSVGAVVKIATIKGSSRHQEGKTLLQLAMSRAEIDPKVTNCCRILHEYKPTSDLIHAVLSEDVDLLKEMLSTGKGCSVNIRWRDHLGPTLLSHAIESNNLDIARLLVEAGSRVNRVRLREHDTVSTTVPLFHKALENGVSQEMAKYIFAVQDYTERTEKDSRGNTAILQAIEKGLSESLIHWLIVAHGGTCLTHRNQHGVTPRELATQKGRTDVVYTIDKFVEQQSMRFSLLYLPVHFYSEDSLNITQLGSKFASEAGENGIRNTIQSVEARGLAMFEAVARGDLAQVQKLNEANYQDKNGFTALTRAIVFAQPEVTKYLCTSRPELKSIADNSNRYPLHYACALPDDQLMAFARILLERNPEEIESRVDKDGRFPVDYKNLRGTEEIRWMLYDARTLDAYGQRGPPLGEWPPGSEASAPLQEE